MYSPLSFNYTQRTHAADAFSEAGVVDYVHYFIDIFVGQRGFFGDGAFARGQDHYSFGIKFFEQFIYVYTARGFGARFDPARAVASGTESLFFGLLGAG